MDYQTILELQNKLVLEEKVSLAYAAILTENALYRFDERVREGVMKWLDGTLTWEFTVECISLQMAREKRTESLFQALCILDIALKNKAFIKTVNWQEWEDDICVE